MNDINDDILDINDDILDALKSERLSETITMFKLLHPNTRCTSISFVRRHWKLFRRHIPLSQIKISNNNVNVDVALPEWLGSTVFKFYCFEPGDGAIVVDCMDLKLKYDSLSDALVDN
jgi:hypothetical protein